MLIIIDIIKRSPTKLQRKTYKHLRYSADGHVIYNPTLITIWLDILTLLTSKFSSTISSNSFRVSFIINRAEDVNRLKFTVPCACLREYFLNINGISISDFVRNIRMQKALEFIKSSKYKIQEVSEMVGYDTERRFREAFTTYYGKPPSHYVKK